MLYGLMYLTYGSGMEHKYLIRCALDYKQLLKPKQRCSSHLVRQQEKKELLHQILIMRTITRPVIYVCMHL